MVGREYARPEHANGIAALDAQSGEGLLFSPVIKTRAKTTTKTV